MHPWQSTVVQPGVDVSIVDACAAGGGVGFSFAASTADCGGTRKSSLQRPDRRPAARSSSSRSRCGTRRDWRARAAAQLRDSMTSAPTGSLRFAGWSNRRPGSENLIAEQELSAETPRYYVGHLLRSADGALQSAGPVRRGRSAMPLLIRGMEVTLSEDIAADRLAARRHAARRRAAERRPHADVRRVRPAVRAQQGRGVAGRHRGREPGPDAALFLLRLHRVPGVAGRDPGGRHACRGQRASSA